MSNSSLLPSGVTTLALVPAYMVSIARSRLGGTPYASRIFTICQDLGYGGSPLSKAILVLPQVRVDGVPYPVQYHPVINLCDLRGYAIRPSTFALSHCGLRPGKLTGCEGTIVDGQVLEEYWYTFLSSISCCAQQALEVVEPGRHPLLGAMSLNLSLLSPLPPSHLIDDPPGLPILPFTLRCLHSSHTFHQFLPFDGIVGTEEKLFGFVQYPTSLQGSSSKLRRASSKSAAAPLFTLCLKPEPSLL
ncbi:hypothetical protein NQZ68_007556 [Dissostichus eleginoides]|nr:hypothetical protein NQZ68_007556 [Dissostichus eleginoides]